MAVVVAQGSTDWDSTDAVGTTKAIDLSGSGFSASEPLKAIFVYANAQSSTVDATASADIKMMAGVATGTAARGGVSAQSDDGAGAAATDRVTRTDCVACFLSTTGTDGGRLDISVFGDDDFTFIVDVVTGADKRVHWIAFGGADFDVASVGSFTFTADAATTQDVTVTGFEASPATADQCVFILSGSIAAGTANVNSAIAVGVAAGSTPTNYVAAITSTDAADPTDTSSYCLTGEIAANVGASQAVGARSSISAWLANGFRFNRIEADAQDRAYVYLAMKGPLFAAFDFTIPTNTTPFAETGFGFTPKGAIFVTCGRAASTADTATVGAELSIGAAANSTDQRVVAVYDQDNAGTTDCDHSVQYGEVALAWTAGGGTLDAAVALDSFDSDGLTLHCTNAAGAGSKFVWGLALGAASTAYTLAVDTGSYAQTGNAVGLNHGQTLQVDTGAYAVTGNAVGLTAAQVLPVDAGAYALTGNDVGLFAALVLPLDTGVYDITGNDVGLTYGYGVLVDAGAYALTGNDVGVTMALTTPLDAGSYGLTGNDVGLGWGQFVTLDAGAYSLTGNDVGLTAALVLPVDAGAYALTGNDVGLGWGQILAVESGFYSLVGNDVDLAYVRDLVVYAGRGLSTRPIIRTS